MCEEDVKTVDENDVKDEYRAGTGSHPCPLCGETCEIRHNISEFSESIYCESCRVKFVRDRDPVFENDYEDDDRKTIIELSKEDKSGYVKYRCFGCCTDVIEPDYRLHEKTVPNGDFEPVETGIQGYDSCSLTCPCGEMHNAYIDIGETIECRCGRTYHLSMIE